tara:strand:- start:2507 stop:2917 length:411 start_codon:yes stop_codon:yes gene_type:complete
MKVHSKIEPDTLIAIVNRFDDISEYRTDLSPPEEFLQGCARKISKSVQVPAHKHIGIVRETTITQESWIIHKGSVRVAYYDIDDSFLLETDLHEGDCAILYRGGHSLEVLEDNTIFYEFKTGPYFGVDADKENLNV